jgi:type VI secretion system secreted protein VgrG
VVGAPGAVATTTRDHQVRIQFAWQRGQGANPGGIAHDTDAKGSAPGDDSSGTWVRVAEALAGPNWGSQFTPRIGTEVLVDFIDNDMDRPLVVAQLYTGADQPPYAAGVESSANHGGTLSGIHSHNFDGGGYNQWQLDDTPGQVRTRLATSSAATQLNLGYLIQQAPGSAQRGAYRGSGFELRTDAWAVVRGGEGVLLTTSARGAQGSGVASTQMDAAEAVRALQAAQELGKVLGDVATKQNALLSADAAKAQQELLSHIDPKDKGKHDGAVNGQEASKAQSGARALDAAQPVEKFAEPLVLMDAPASINWATPASTVLFAGEQLHWTSQGDAHMTAAHTLSSVAANAAGYFSQNGGIQAIAANGPVSLQAHTDQLEILADKEVKIISVNDSIEIKANQKIVLQAGQSSITLDGGDITFACPGNFTVKGGQHVFDGGASPATMLPALPTELESLVPPEIPQPGDHSLRFAFAGADTLISDLAMVGKKYTITDTSGAVLASGSLDSGGRLPRLDFPAAKDLLLHIGDEKWRSVPIDAEADDPDMALVADLLPDESDPYHHALGQMGEQFHLPAALLQKLIENPEGEE